MKKRLLRLTRGLLAIRNRNSSCADSDMIVVAFCILFGLSYALFDKVAAKKDLTQTITTKGDPVSVVPESTESATRWQQEGKSNGSQGRKSEGLHGIMEC